MSSFSSVVAEPYLRFDFNLRVLKGYFLNLLALAAETNELKCRAQRAESKMVTGSSCLTSGALYVHC